MADFEGVSRRVRIRKLRTVGVLMPLAMRDLGEMRVYWRYLGSGKSRGEGRSVSKGQFIASIFLAEYSRCLNHACLDSRDLPLSTKIQSKEAQFKLKGSQPTA